MRFEMGCFEQHALSVFTMSPAFPTLPQVVPYRLFRPETQYQDGKHVRDLSKLNRDLSQVCGLDSLGCHSRCRPAVAQQET